MRFYSLLLHCYPPSYRAAYGDEMRAVFAQSIRAEPPRLGWLGYAAAAIADVVPNAAAVHADVLRSDLAHARRLLVRAPWVTAGAILVLATGVGANAAVFNILRGILLRPLPYRAADRVVMVWAALNVPPGSQRVVAGAGAAKPRAIDPRQILTAGMVLDIRATTTRQFTDVAALDSWQGNLEAAFDLPLSDRTERIRGAFVTPNFFQLLGVRADWGRTFGGSDEHDAASPLVISDALWRRDFGGDPRIVGRVVTLIAGRAPRAPRAFTVVGVLPPDFRFTYPQETEAWAMLPWSDMLAGPRNALVYRVVARLAPAVTMDQARAALAAVPPPIMPQRRGSAGPTIVYWPDPIRDWVVGDVRAELLLLGGVAVLLLLVTCTTGASVIGMRAASRQGEIAIRAAIGADARRLFRQLLTEGAVLAFFGAAVGVALAIAAAPVVRSLIPDSMPRGDEVSPAGGALATTAVLATLVTLLATLAPLRRAIRVDLLPALQGMTPPKRIGVAAFNWRQRVIGAQSVVTTVLLIAAALLIASFWRLGHVPLGFDAEHVLTVEMRLLDRKYRDTTRLTAFQDELVARVRALPGVQAAGLTSAVPFRGVDFTSNLDRPGGAERVAAATRFVDSSYFDVMRMPLLRGRLFGTLDDRLHARVAVVSESFARQMFGGEDPIGQPIDVDTPKIVVGVVRDVRYAGFDRDPVPAVYIPRTQVPSELICVVARTSLPLAPAKRAVEKIVHDIDPLVPPMNVTTIDQIVESSTAGRRFYMVATLAFAAVALVLTIAGLAALVSRSVVERRRELAIRLAVGASSRQLIGLVAREGLTPAAIGCLSGVLIAAAGAKVLAKLLFHTSAYDPIATVGVPVAIVAIAGVAALLAGRSVLRVAPMNVLRGE